MFSHTINIVEPTVSNKLTLQMESRKAADRIVEQVREGSEIIRPLLGESAPFMSYKDTYNHICLLYLDHDQVNSQKSKKDLYKLLSYTDEFTGNYKKQNEAVLIESIERLTFTRTSPDSVQVNITLANEKNRFQFLTHIGLMNISNVE